MRHISKIITAIVVGVFALGVFSSAHAATLSLMPVSSEIGVGEKIMVELKIDSDGVSFNAAQAVVRFPKDVLEVTALDTSGSAFSFWLEEPTFSNAEGIISFTGGTPYGVSGGAVWILKIEFLGKGTGSGMLSLTEAAITAADGSGTNILSKMSDAAISVIPQRVAPKIPEPQQKIPEPEQIIRKPEVASGLPAKPVLKIPLYPEGSRWHNSVAQFIASWELPLDVSGVSTLLNKNPNSNPSEQSEGLFDNKTFGALQDGIWYLHVRFKNNIGWGPTAHYRLSIDTQPPLPFEVDVPTGPAGDNPSPKLLFATSDALSGINRYEIIVNSEAPIVASGSAYTLFPHKPGTYFVFVRAYDNAGNSIEDKVDIEVLPIESPEVTFLTKRVVIGTDDMLTIRGTALPDATVIVTLENSDKFLVLQNEVQANLQGEWEFRLDRELRRGDYAVSVIAKDARGALSDATMPVAISVVEKPVISLFGLDITLRWLLILMVIAGIVVAGWFYRKTILRLARSQRESIIISRDLGNTIDMVKKQLTTIGSIVKKNASGEASEVEFKTAKKKITDALDTIAKYLSKDIERLK